MQNFDPLFRTTAAPKVLDKLINSYDLGPCKFDLVTVICLKICTKFDHENFPVKSLRIMEFVCRLQETLGVE